MSNTHIDTIRVRMYKTGSVGDCFLLLFEKAGTVSFTMLIDCGGYKTQKKPIQDAVADIKKSIINNTIDLVVATHEHEDHLSGFNQARALFDTITFKQVWLSWAENNEDPLAVKLFREKGKKIKELQAAIKSRLASVKRNLRQNLTQTGIVKNLNLRRDSLMHALEMLDFDDKQSLAANASARLRIRDAMQYVKDKSMLKTKSKMYKRPGQVINDLKGAEGVRFHILGPPYDTDLHGIKNDLDHSEMYSLSKKLGLSVNQFQFFALSNADKKEGILVSPFSKKHQMTEQERKTFFRTYYNTKRKKWRQIEYDWLDAADELSIALTDFVNNTSLAMAISIGDKVLLFPADAQSGNWMSWHDPQVQKDLVKNGGMSTSDLLKKTVFYKVGHHGSHNGTASKSGLEKMGTNKIMAFMPLVQNKVPTAWGGSDNFPAKGLYKKIIEKTGGAVIRTDEGLIKDPGAGKLRSNTYTAAEIDVMKKASANPLYHEWVVKVQG